MKKLMKILFASMVLVGCGSSNNEVNINNAEEYAKENNIKLIDVREPDEYAEGHLEGSTLVPLNELEDTIPLLIPNLNEEFIVYCRSGNRSGQAKELLEKQGYTNVINAGGVLDYTGELTK